MKVESWIKSRGMEVGFDLVGIAPARRFAEHAALQQWLAAGMQGTMAWMERSIEKRLDPVQVMPTAKSVIVVAKNYNAPLPYSTECQEPGRGWISRYAWGDDYHETLLATLKRFVVAIDQKEPGSFWSAYVDTGPNMERVFAKHAGVGWIGKNTCIIHPKLGSFLFLGVILTNLELAPDPPATDHCGSCTRCIDACPTNALAKPYELDARKCISYLTIEHRGPIDEAMQAKMGKHLFGCDICQDVCPWNRKSPRTAEAAFQPREGLFNPELTAFQRKVEEDYPSGFKHSPLKRTKQEGLLRNIAIAKKNARDQ